MPVIGLTGNIASGKSHIAEIFSSFGALISNSDTVAHEVMNEEAFEEIKSLFPNAVEGNEINRRMLGQIVFNDEEKLKQLEQVLHPLVRKKNIEFIQANRGKLLVLEIPLLFETNADEICDHTIFVNVSRETQESRALARAGMNPIKLQKILERQHKIPVEEKIKKAHFIIDNNPGMDATRQVKEIINSISPQSLL